MYWGIITSRVNLQNKIPRGFFCNPIRHELLLTLVIAYFIERYITPLHVIELRGPGIDEKTGGILFFPVKVDIFSIIRLCPMNLICVAVFMPTCILDTTFVGFVRPFFMSV